MAERKARSKTGEAIPADRRRPQDIADLEDFLADAKRRKKPDEAKRFAAILAYIGGERAALIAERLKIERSVINKWMRWYATAGVEGLLTKSRPGAPRRLTDEQRAAVVAAVKAGPNAAGYESGMWTGPMVADYIERRFGVKYHHEYVPRLLHKLGFSVQRPRKRLARADAELQREWVEERLPAIKKKPGSAAERS